MLRYVSISYPAGIADAPRLSPVPSSRARRSLPAHRVGDRHPLSVPHPRRRTPPEFVHVTVSVGSGARTSILKVTANVVGENGLGANFGVIVMLKVPSCVGGGMVIMAAKYVSVSVCTCIIGILSLLPIKGPRTRPLAERVYPEEEAPGVGLSKISNPVHGQSQRESTSSIILARA